MKIGIIGAGHIGGNLAGRLTAAGHDVSIANSRGPDTLRDVASKTGAKPVEAADAARDKDLVIVTIPEKGVTDLPKDLFAATDRHTVVVDTGNYYPKRDGKIEPIEDGETESRWVSDQLGRPVVKAFNTIYAHNLVDRARPKGDDKRLALPVAGDDANAKKVVMQVIDEIGFDSVDAGGLDDSWRQQPGTPVYGAELDASGVEHALAQAKQERPKEFRA
ncbi:MAG TPA: NAD(P)-binding domain-containing protein [Gemmatimonadaceae bacterium]|nr:NAD(P)-binding domain-containing protein [Gemmatimonadaceae bacterium]